jgi:hypothetical protein
MDIKTVVCGSRSFFIDSSFISPCFVDVVLFPGLLMVCVVVFLWCFVLPPLSSTKPVSLFFVLGLFSIALPLVELAVIWALHLLSSGGTLVRLGITTCVTLAMTTVAATRQARWIVLFVLVVLFSLIALSLQIELHTDFGGWIPSGFRLASLTVLFVQSCIYWFCVEASAGSENKIVLKGNNIQEFVSVSTIDESEEKIHVQGSYFCLFSDFLFVCVFFIALCFFLDSKESPEESASLLSHMVFAWATPLIASASVKKSLSEHDVWPLRSTERSAVF